MNGKATPDGGGNLLHANSQHAKEIPRLFAASANTRQKAGPNTFGYHQFTLLLLRQIANVFELIVMLFQNGNDVPVDCVIENHLVHHFE